MNDLLGYTDEELTRILNLPPFRCKQINKWLYSGYEFSEMSDLPKDLRERLNAEYYAQPLTIIEKISSVDGTVKYLYRLHDGNIIEGVKMSYNYGDTLCVSTQVGCRMGCVFCASGQNGLVRNLTAAEILGQAVCVNRLNGGGLGYKRTVTNLVLMGMGEPLDNYDNVVKFLKLVNYDKGLNISLRNISLSTCGLVPQIKRLADEGIVLNLTISLHNAFDEKRKIIMPVARKYSVNEIIDACKYYFNKTGRRIIFEYVLLKSNISKEDAIELSNLLKSFPSHINLIMLNTNGEANKAAEAYNREDATEVYCRKEAEVCSQKDAAEEYNRKEAEAYSQKESTEACRQKESVEVCNQKEVAEACSQKEAEIFKRQLESNNLSVTLRRSMGSDIQGACGQLRAKFGGCKKD